MTHPQWSDGFLSDERAERRAGARELVTSLAAGALGFAAAGAEVTMSILFTTREVTTSYGSWVLAMLALALGFIGPYAAALTWRSPARAGQAPYRRLEAAALTAIGMAAITIPWLLLIRSSNHPPPFLPR